MHHLSTFFGRRSGSHARLHSPRRSKRNCRCTSAEYTQRTLSPRLDEKGPRSHHCGSVSCVPARVLRNIVCRREEEIPWLGGGSIAKCRSGLDERLRDLKEKQKKQTRYLFLIDVTTLPIHDFECIMSSLWCRSHSKIFFIAI